MSRNSLLVKTILIVLTALSVACAAHAADHYAAANGKPTGDGSINNPWDLQTALNQPASVQPGDTIWVRGGTYLDQFNGMTNGTAAAPIIVRNYNGERVTLQGQSNDQFVLYVGGTYTWYWGLEITSNCAQRTRVVTSVCPFGIGDYGAGNKFIDNVIHDTLQGFSGYNSSPDTELFGNLSYYNGYQGTDRNHGHGIYAQNSTGSKTISDNIVGDNADEGIQIYGSGSAAIVNFTISGNAIYNNSSWPTPAYQYNLIVAGGQTRKNITVQNNYSYYTPGAGGFVQFGQYTQGQDMSITNNVFANGYITVSVFEQAGPVVFTGNKITASPDSLRVGTLDLFWGQSISSYTWDNNAYYDTSIAHFYQGFTSDGSTFSGTNTSFSGWQGQTQFDAHSTYQASRPTGTWTYVRPNKYEAKRGNVIIYNWDSAATVFVDLSSVLSPGDQFVIQDAQNFYGPAAASGVYSGNPVAIPMTGLAKAAGVGFAAPAHTEPTFGTFVVLPAGATATQSQGATPMTPSNPTTPSTPTTPSAPSAAPTATAKFIKVDSSTQGNWQAAYGADGYALAQGAQSNPSYGTVAVQNNGTWTWANSSTDVRALSVPGGTGRLAATWFSLPGTPTFSFDVNVKDGNSHAFALYAVDFDSRGRSEMVQVLDAGTGTVLDTENLSSFTNGVYLAWSISGHVTVNVTATGGPNAVVSGAFFGAGSAKSGGTGITSTSSLPSNTPSTNNSTPASGTSATFVIADTVTQGSWQGKYGADGYDVAGFATQSMPVYAPVNVSNAGSYTWSASTTDLRGAQTVGTPGRLAAAWYNNKTGATTFSFDVNVTDSNSHQIALYALDWDSQGRSETVQIVNAATNAVLDTRTLSGFSTGIYLVWNISGHVTVNVTSTGGPNAVVSGLFFGAGTANTNTAASAAFVNTDTATQGNWQGVYGLDGNDIANAPATAVPAYATFTPQGEGSFTWAAPTGDSRALQVGGTRFASCWFTTGATAYSLDLNITDGNTHQFDLYALDWDNRGRSETITVTDAASGAVLDTRSVTNFSQGVYYIWKLAGHVKITVTSTSGPNAVISGTFFD